MYDYGYKQLFSHPEMIQNLLKGFCNPAWFSEMDLLSLEKVNSHYIADNYKQRENDTVWKIKFRNQWVYLYILLEFQSTVDKYMAIRLMSYIGLFYQDLLRSKQIGANKLLPPILPWVIYLGDRKWTAEVKAHKLLESSVPQGLKCYFPHFEYCLLDIGHYPIKPENLSSNNLIYSLIQLEQSVNDRTQAQHIIELLTTQLQSPDYDSLRRAFAQYIIRVLKLEKASSSIDIHELSEVKTMLLAKRIEAYDNRLIQRGKNEGIKEGRLKGKKEIIARMLSYGFNKTQITEITQITEQELENYIK